MLMVQKYGGSSLADVRRIQQAAARVAGLAMQGCKMVVVVSAQGDTTDEMIQKSTQVNKRGSVREMDAYLAAGEQMSAALMAMALQKMGYPAVSLTGWQAGLQTDGNYGDARIVGLCNDRIQKELDRGCAVIVGGFQGVAPNGDITTLGRGGSDTTAVALAAFLQADVCRIYTDVDGVYDRDPRLFPDAVRYDRLDYDTMLHMAQNGAKVLHDRCVEIAKQHGVKVHVLSSFRTGEGTLVGP